VDERLVMPETRFEILDGKVAHVAPADEPHGTLHARLAGLLETHVVPAYQCAVDMLTRTSTRNDMAPDASVFARARDPQTGGRMLEELAFEVVSTESLAHAAHKARKLSARGVRRVFAVNVERQRVLEWSRATDAWEILPDDGTISDATLLLPLPVQAMVAAAGADEAMARAVLARKHPVIEEALDAKRIQGRIEALLDLLAERGIAVPPAAEARIRGEQDTATLRRWTARAAACGAVEELFA
jgi:Uma2 family endonuclease